MGSGPFPKRSALLSCGLAVVDVRQPQFRHAKPKELRLSRLVAMHMPSNAPFLVRHRFMPARWRLIAFNDDLLTRHKDVIALLDRAIDHLRVRRQSASPPDQVTRLRYHQVPKRVA